MNSVDNPMAFPYPQPTCRPTKPMTSSTATTLSNINQKELKRGVISLDDQSVGSGKYNGPKLTMEALLKYGYPNGSGKGAVIGGGGAVIRKDDVDTDGQSIRSSRSSTREGGGGKRSSSAPPRSLGAVARESRGHHDDNDGQSSATSSQISGAGGERGPRIVGAGGSVSSGGNRIDASAITKWSSSLGEYYKSKEQANAASPALTPNSTTSRGTTGFRGGGNRSGDDASTASPGSYASVSTASRGTTNFNKSKGGVIMGGSGKQSLREQFGAANAPFATDFS